MDLNSEKETNLVEKLKIELDATKAILNSQIENTIDSVWSVDSNLKIKTLNSVFKNSYKAAFGVDLSEGYSVTTSLPEPMSNVWRERYYRALNGENYSVLDVLDINEFPVYSETFFNPIILDGKCIGVACVTKDITEQKLREEKLNKIFNNSHSAISIQTNQEIILVNKAWEDITGYSEEESKTLKPFDLIHPKSRQKIIKIATNRIKGKKAPSKYNFHLITKQGEEKWVDISISVIDYLGKKASLIIGNDITAFHQLQEATTKSEANLNALIENTEARIWSIDKEMKIVSINSNYKKDFQQAFNVELKKGVSALEGIPEFLYDTWDSRYTRALHGEKFSITDEIHFHKLLQFTETSFNPIYFNEDIVGVSCLSRDISEQKRFEQALKKSESQLKTLLSNIPSVSYRRAMDSFWTIEFISEEIKTLSGHPPEDFINNKVLSFASIIHPEDTGKVTKIINDAVKAKKKYLLTYRIIHANGVIHWVNERGRAQYDSSGEVEWLDGVISDISRQKDTEEALAKSELKYRNIFNSMTDIYIRVDLEGYIQIISPSVKDISGYKAEELIGTPFSDLYKQPEDRNILRNSLLAKGSLRDFEICLKSKSGEVKTLALNASLIYNENGNPIAIEGVGRDISLRKIAEQSLQERTKELNTIFDNAPVILILVDENGEVLNINRAATSFSKKKSAEVLNSLGSEVLKCINSYSKNSGCGKTKNCNGCVIRQTLNTTFSTQVNQNQVEGSITIVTNDKHENRHFLISTTYIGTENTKRVLISLDDITDIKEAQEEIRKLSKAVEQSMATIVITNKQGEITYANPQFEKSTGYSVKEILGKNPRILKSKNTTSSEYKELWQTILAGETWQGEFLNVRKDGSEYWERAIISPIFNDQNKITDFIAIKEDITERKRIQEELIASEKELRQINTQRSKFTSILAHDLRGLVGSYHAYSDLIYSKFENFSNEELKEQIENLSKSSGESLKLLDNLLDWGRATQGNINVLSENLNLKIEVETLIKLLSEFSNAKGIKLINTSDADISIFSDANIIQTVLRNLVYNAIKFTPKGGEIRISYKKKPNNKVEMSVEDTGIGMSPSIINKLFKTGEKVVRIGTSSESGSGLGLLICEEMVKHLGGKIEVESQEGKGSRFFFTIPAKQEN